MNGLEQQGAEHDSSTIAPRINSQVRIAPTLAVGVATAQRTDSDPDDSHLTVFASSEDEDNVGETGVDYNADDAGVEYHDHGDHGGADTVVHHESTEGKHVQQV